MVLSSMFGLFCKNESDLRLDLLIMTCVESPSFLNMTRVESLTRVTLSLHVSVTKT